MKYVGPSFFIERCRSYCVAALYKADKLNERSARQVCSHVHLVQAVCRQRNVRQFADFRDVIHFSDGH
jgi:hypothetical protein